MVRLSTQYNYKGRQWNRSLIETSLPLLEVLRVLLLVLLVLVLLPTIPITVTITVTVTVTTTIPITITSTILILLLLPPLSVLRIACASHTVNRTLF